VAKSLKKNFFLNCILTGSSILFPVLTFPYVSRILLPSGMGVVSFALSVVAYFDLFAQLGIPTYGIRACARVRQDRVALSRTVHEILTINLVTMLVSYAVLLLSIFFVPKFREERTLYLIVSATMLLSTFGMEWLYKALEQYTYITLRSLFFKFLAMIGMFLLIHEQSDYVIYGGISIFASSASNVLNFIHARRFIDFHFLGEYQYSRHFKPILIFFAMACATTVYTNLDTVMLGVIQNDSEVGLYNSAVKIKCVLVSVVTSLGAVMLPRVSSYIEKGRKDEFWRLSKKALNFVILLSVPLALFFMIYSRPSIYLLSGGAFEGAIFPMRVIMPTLVFIGVTNVLGIQILVPMMKEQMVLYSSIAGAVVNLIANVGLIPSYGATGAAIGTVLAEFAVLVVQYLSLKHHVSDLFRSICYGKIIVALIAGMLAAIWTLWANFSNFVTLFLSAALFFGVYGAVLILTGEPLVTEILSTFKAKLVSKSK